VQDEAIAAKARCTVAIKCHPSLGELTCSSHFFGALMGADPRY